MGPLHHQKEYSLAYIYPAISYAPLDWVTPYNANGNELTIYQSGNYIMISGDLCTGLVHSVRLIWTAHTFCHCDTLACMQSITIVRNGHRDWSLVSLNIYDLSITIRYLRLLCAKAISSLIRLLSCRCQTTTLWMTWSQPSRQKGSKYIT